MSLRLDALRTFLRALPEGVHAAATAAAGSRLLARLPEAARLAPLEGKRLWITITDADTCLRYRLEAGRLVADASEGEPDVHLRGRLRDFLRLAARQEDPDTLFFARDLCLEGNTEDGLLFKNFLDSLDTGPEELLRRALPPLLAGPTGALARHLRPWERFQRWVGQIS